MLLFWAHQEGGGAGVAAAVLEAFGAALLSVMSGDASLSLSAGDASRAPLAEPGTLTIRSNTGTLKA